jgi:hypothetical protein
MHEFAAAGHHQNAQQPATFPKNGGSGAGKFMRPLAVVVLVIQLHGNLSLKTKAYSGCPDISLGPAEADGTIANGKLCFYFIASRQVQDVAFIIRYSSSLRP